MTILQSSSLRDLTSSMLFFGMTKAYWPIVAVEHHHFAAASIWPGRSPSQRRCPDAMRNHITSIGAPRSAALKRLGRARSRRQPSQSTTRSARISSSLLTSVARRPTTRPFSSDQPVASVRTRKSNPGYFFALAYGRKLRKSHLRGRRCICRPLASHQRNAHGVGRHLHPERDRLNAQLEELIEQAGFMHHLQRRGMYGVAVVTAQEPLRVFQHHDPDAGARQQKAQHHPA